MHVPVRSDSSGLLGDHGCELDRARTSVSWSSWRGRSSRSRSGSVGVVFEIKRACRQTQSKSIRRWRSFRDRFAFHRLHFRLRHAQRRRAVEQHIHFIWRIARAEQRLARRQAQQGRVSVTQKLLQIELTPAPCNLQLLCLRDAIDDANASEQAREQVHLFRRARFRRFNREHIQHAVICETRVFGSGLVYPSDL